MCACLSCNRFALARAIRSAVGIPSPLSVSEVGDAFAWAAWVNSVVVGAEVVRCGLGPDGGGRGMPGEAAAGMVKVSGMAECFEGAAPLPGAEQGTARKLPETFRPPGPAAQDASVADGHRGATLPQLPIDDIMHARCAIIA